MQTKAMALGIALAGMAAVAAAGITPETLRVYVIQHDSFDYAFLSYQDGADGQTILSINHRGGRTFFVKPGEKVDGYRVVRFEPRTERVYNPSINTSQTVKSGKVTLQGPGDKLIVLEQGKLLEQPGWRATLVVMDTGSRWDVREGESISESNVTVRVVSIWPDSVAVDFGHGEVKVAKVSDGEKTGIIALWKSQQEESREQALLAAQQYEAESAGKRLVQVGVGQGANGVAAGGNMMAGRVVGIAGSEPQMTIGTEYRYPSEYEIWYFPQGTNRVLKPVFIPKKFETRVVGGTIGPGPDFTWTSVHPGGANFPPSSTMTPYPYPLPRFSRFEYKTKP